MDWVAALAAVATLGVVIWEAVARRRERPKSNIWVEVTGEFSASDGSLSGHCVRIVNVGDRSAMVAQGIHFFGAKVYLEDRPQLPSVLVPGVEHDVWVTETDRESAYVRFVEIAKRPRLGALITWRPLFSDSEVGEKYDAQLGRTARMSRREYRRWAEASPVGPDGVPGRFLRKVQSGQDQALMIALGEVPPPEPHSRWSLPWMRDRFRALMRRSSRTRRG